jgi:hypothetical protein
MSPVSFTTAIQYFDDRQLRDIGVESDGALTDPRDPRYRRIARPTSLVDRLLAAALTTVLLSTRARPSSASTVRGA